MLEPSAERIARDLGDALRACGLTLDRLAGELDPIQDALVDLLIEGVPVERHRIPSELLTPLLDLALARPNDETSVVAPRNLRPYSDGVNDFFVVSDADEPVATGTEHVLGIGHASLTLASLTPRLQVQSALDIGTGSGVQALHLATHADVVVAIDVSSEALECAALSAALSGVELKLRQGSLYEPIGDERFDLIVSNPPFVISPGKSFTYRDAGRYGDDFVHDLVAHAHRHLNAGGWFVTLANWLHPAGTDWRERMMEWIAPTGCDAWVVQRDLIAPADYVRIWTEDAGTGDEQAWLAWFETNQIEAIGFGWIVLHAGDRDVPHRRFETLTHPVEHPMGPWLLQHFVLEDLAADLDDDALLRTPMSLTDVTLDRRMLTVNRGWHRGVRIDGLIEEFLNRIDPTHPIGEALSNLPTEQGIDVESAADLVRGLMQVGALAPTSIA